MKHSNGSSQSSLTHISDPNDSLARWQVRISELDNDIRCVIDAWHSVAD